jgi:hypothetical protein
LPERRDVGGEQKRKGVFRDRGKKLGNVKATRKGEGVYSSYCTVGIEPKVYTDLSCRKFIIQALSTGASDHGDFENICEENFCLQEQIGVGKARVVKDPEPSFPGMLKRLPS